MGGGGVLNRFFTTKGAPSCEDLIIRTQLLSTRRDVLSQISKGDNLSLELLSNSGPCVAVFQTEIVGTVIHRDLLQLMVCINNGKSFVAIVRSVDGGACLVTIKPKAL